MSTPRPATEARQDVLEELTHSIRAHLLERGESPPSSWIEESSEDLARGRMRGWYLAAPGGEGEGLGFYSTRPRAAFGHVHVEPGEGAVARAAALVEAIRRDLSPNIESLDIGFTGLDPTGEHALADLLHHPPERTMLKRWAMERAIVPEDIAPIADAPSGIRMYPIRSLPREALVELDVRAFRNTVDAQLIGTDRTEYGRMLDELIEGRLGRFLDEASTALVDASTSELEAALLTSEQTPRMAIYLDVMVEPSHRRRGLGRYLVRWGFRALAALGYSTVRLWVTSENEPARALYRATGFREVASAVIYREVRPPGQPHSG